MITQELIDSITQGYRQGKNKDEIKTSLMNSGYDENDIDGAISHIQKVALQQLPLINKLTSLMHRMDQRTAHTPPKIVIGVLLGTLLFVVLIAFFLYNLLDPFSFKTAARDTQREQAFTQLHAAIEAYKKENYLYPASLDKLVPKYISQMPLDPKSHQPYQYQLNNGNYQLCTDFETRPVQCVSSDTTSSIPVAVPNDASAQ